MLKYFVPKIWATIPLVGGTVESHNNPKLTPKIILYMIILGGLAACFNITWTTMNKREDLTILPALSSGAKILSVGLVGIFFLKEEITFKKIISSILILSGIVIYFK